MSLKTKFFAGIFAISTFAVAGYAQDTKADAKTGDSKIERKRDRAGRGMFGGGFGRLGRGLFGVELTDAQKAEVRRILEANKPNRAALQEVRTLARAKWEGTLTADQQARLDTLRAETKAKAKSVHEQLLAVLTPEQKTQLEQRKQEMRTKMQEMRQKMKEHRQLHQKKTTTTDTTKTN
ncbi:MAG TPA: Spy/CpxP family protein refolding chaperone [Pyrinomonadaceae bacterium]|nr:Spy/CpxP family protein refolding chaperone [Pyrinomonadaceae bacterium]